LVKKRIIVAGWDERRGRATIQVSHESLVRGWNKLREWIDAAEQDFLLWRQDLRWKLVTWTVRGGAKRFLLDEQSLQEAQSWVEKRFDDLLEDEEHFIEMSSLVRQRELEERAWREEKERVESEREKDAREKEEEAKNRRRRWKIALGLTMLMFVFWLQWHMQRTRQEALRSRSVALSAEALRLAERDFDLALLLALQANRIAETAEARGALLELMAGSPHLQAFLPHTEKTVRATAFGPKGEIATGGAGKVYLWSSERGVPLRPPLKILPANQILGLAFSQDGTFLAASSESGGVYLWNLRTGESLDPIETEEPVRTLAFSSEGLLAGGSASGKAKIFVWNTSGKLLHALPTQGKWISGLAFGPGSALASAIEDTTVSLWDARIGQKLWSAQIEQGESALGLSFQLDGKLLVSAGTTLYLWDVATGRHVGSPCALAFGKDDGITSVAFSRDGAMVASGHLDRKIRLWDVPVVGRCRLTSTLTGHNGFVWSMAFGHGKRLVSGGDGGDVVLWKVNAPSSPFSRIIEKTRGLATLAVSPIEHLVAIGDSLGRLYFYRYDGHRAGKVKALKSRYQNSVNQLVFHPDGQVLASGGKDGRVLLWEVQTRRILGILRSPRPGSVDPIRSLVFCPEDGAWIAAGTKEGQLVVWHLESTGYAQQSFSGHVGQLPDLAFVPGTGCRRLVTAGYDRRLLLWDLEQEKWIEEIPDAHAEAITSLAFGQDGLLVSGSYDGYVRLWNVGDTLEPEGALNGPAVFDLAFSRDGRTLAAAGVEGDAHQIFLWNMNTRTPIGRGFQSPTKVGSLAFDEEGSSLLTAGKETVLQWDLSPETWRSRLCMIVNREISEEEWKRYMAKDDYEPICAPVLTSPK
jgi:WD40 repeat protein